jgi:glucose/mannose-6-phosphate isomerase
MARARGGVHVPCPDGYLPRAAIGALVAPLFVALERVGMLPDAGTWLDAAGRQLAIRREKCRPDVEPPANPAREIARKIGTTIPIFYGGGALGAVAAQRWKCDVNENAKAPAFWNSYPELDHNEICGWGQHGDVTRQLFTLVELRHDSEHEQIGRRFKLTRALIEETLAQVLEVRAEGEGRLAQVLDLVYVGDWASCYLALDHDVDPGPIDAIFQLKDALGTNG